MAGRIAVVGCGYWGKNLVRNFAELGALGAVVDPRPEVAQALATTHGVRALSLEACLADPTIEGVAVAAPAELHAEVCIAASNAGKHVFVEKPIALTVEDAERMKAAAEANGKALMVGHLLRYHPAFETLADMVRDGAIGAVRYAYSDRLSLGKFRVEEDVCWSFAPHDLSMLLTLMDADPVSVTATGVDIVTPGVDDMSRIEMAFPGGARAHVFTAWLHPFKRHLLTVVGETGMLVFEDSAAGPEKLRLYRHGIKRGDGAPEPVKAEAEYVPYPSEEPLKRECQHFLDVVEGREATPRTSADEGIRVLKVLTAASASARRASTQNA
ncbi:Gfo/Idh/MocA family protein [Caulobacter soli]|uniref:Gfo/Idh/MocA family protein n=1 Tax=Caulobacter soli TaxID=2708539 RepID=UPI0013EA7D32|nr:Gfo/Idh/MocA family oxidoreductase [Caulobacter soli]